MGRELDKMRQTEDFKKIAASIIKRYWPDSVVEIYEEIKNSPNPDMLVERYDLKIPIEVKTRASGFFSLQKMDDGKCTVSYKPTIKRKQKRQFGHQAYASLRDYGISLFLVNVDVNPESPSYVDVEKGRIILSDFSTLEESLDMAYDFLSKGKGF